MGDCQRRQFGTEQKTEQPNSRHQEEVEVEEVHRTLEEEVEVVVEGPRKK